MNNVRSDSNTLIWTFKIEKAIEYLTYLMILLFYTGRVFQVFTVVIDILFIILLVLRHDKEFIENNKSLFLLWGAFFVYLLIQSLFANHVLVAMANSVGMIRFVILFFALIYVFNTRKKIKNLILSSFIIIATLFVDATIQYITGEDIFGYPLFEGKRLTCWSDISRLSESVAIFGGIVLASFLIIKNKLLPLVIMTFLILILLFSGNRGPVVYLTGAFFTVLLFSNYWKYLLAVMTGFFIIAFLALSLDSRLHEQFSVYKNPFISENNAGRTTIYKVGIEMIKENPLLGIGGKNFRYEFRDYYLKTYEGDKNKGYWDKIFGSISPYHAHSLFFSFLLNWGLLGTVFFFYILYKIYLKYIHQNDVAILCSVGFVYTIAPFNFGKSIAQSPWQFFVFLTLAFVVILGTYNQLYKEDESMKKKMKKI
ncbi:MAG: O-antigen ligase family protein [Campylobacterota bacterium]|nr:O-antigen ligase family protein [Campylobacterota bacterium]